MTIARKSYRDVLARSERLGPDEKPVWPLGFLDRPRAVPNSLTQRDIQS